MSKSTRPAFKRTTIQSLFAKSGNRCAFENCQHELVTTEENCFVGQICHIEGFSVNGPRFNPDLKEKGREFQNLILLCYKHHKIVDSDPIRYDVKYLKLLKKVHESKISSLFVVDDELLKQAEIQEKRFWDEIEDINKNHPNPEMAVNVDTKASVDEIISNLKNDIKNLEDNANWLCNSDSDLSSEIENFLTKIGYNLEEYKKIPHHQNPFEDRNWEFHNLAIPNIIIEIRLALLQLEIKYLELYLAKYPKDNLVKIKFVALKEEMKEWAKCCVHD